MADDDVDAEVRAVASGGVGGGTSRVAVGEVDRDNIRQTRRHNRSSVLANDDVKASGDDDILRTQKGAVVVGGVGGGAGRDVAQQHRQKEIVVADNMSVSKGD